MLIKCFEKEPRQIFYRTKIDLKNSEGGTEHLKFIHVEIYKRFRFYSINFFTKGKVNNKTVESSYVPGVITWDLVSDFDICNFYVIDSCIKHIISDQFSAFCALTPSIILLPDISKHLFSLMINFEICLRNIENKPLIRFPKPNRWNSDKFAVNSTALLLTCVVCFFILFFVAWNNVEKVTGFWTSKISKKFSLHGIRLIVFKMKTFHLSEECFQFMVSSGSRAIDGYNASSDCDCKAHNELHCLSGL